mgnify:CR=1 FL=1
MQTNNITKYSSPKIELVKYSSPKSVKFTYQLDGKTMAEFNSFSMAQVFERNLPFNFNVQNAHSSDMI